MAQAAGPSTRVALRISCKDLKDTDILSKSDPIVAVYMWNDKWIEYGRTEVIKDNLNPEFKKVIEMNYKFEEVQKLRFSVFDVDNATATLDDDDHLGNIECTLAEIVSDTQGYIKPLLIKTKEEGKVNKIETFREKGTIKILAEEITGRVNIYDFKFAGHGLDKKDFFGKSDPYLKFIRYDGSNSPITVFESDVLKNTLNPSWMPFQIKSSTLCLNDIEKVIEVQCYDWDSDSSHDLIGTFKTTLAELSTAADKKNGLQWELINPKKKSKKNYKNSGTIHLESLRIYREYTFLEYIMGGCQINFTVGVDFTASNGDPRDPSSLHYINPGAPNEYQRALAAVGDICQYYDTDKMFPSLGFGAVFQDRVSHEFPLNGNPQNPYCAGVQGILAAYDQTVRSVELYGPTNMAPIINHVANFAEAAKANRDQQNYFILLILTDGEISDMADTKRAVIRASKLPMSIIIVGVGEASFNKMVELDADEGKLTQGLMVAERDIVQFVPFRQFSGNQYALAQAVLAEVPGQLTEYMKKRNITPLVPPPS